MSYYDRQGNPITLQQWMDSYEQDRKVAWTELPSGYLVSTVWLGMGMGFNGPPLIFETMVFHGGRFEGYEQVRTATEREARVKHERLCKKYMRRRYRRPYEW